MSAHLDEAALEALAHGRNDLVADEDRLHLAGCAECGSALEDVRALSKELSVSLMAEAPGLALGDLEAMITGALSKAPDPAYARPSVKALAGAGVVGLSAAAILGLLSLPSTTAVVSFVRDAIMVVGGVDRVVSAFVPGGWSLIALIGFAVVALMAVPFRRVVRAVGPNPASVLGLFGVLLALGSLAFPGGAFALSFEGQWPSPDEGHLVTLTIEDLPVNEALREAAAAAGLGYVSQLEADERRVSLEVRDAELRVVIETILGDAPVVARRSERSLVLTPAEPSGAQSAAVDDASDDGTSQAGTPTMPLPLAVPGIPTPPAVAPAVPVAPVAPAPPAIPPDVNISALPDRETFGGDIHIRANEKVRHVTSTGGDVRVEGMVYGNVTSMGGDIEVEDGGVVYGELVSMGGDVEVRSGGAAYGQMVTMGGDVEVDEGAIVTGARVAMDAPDVSAMIDEGGRRRFRGGDGDDHEAGGFGAWVKKAISSAAQHALLFVLGVLLLALAPGRLGALRRTIARAPIRSIAAGFMGFVGTVVLTLALAVTIIGILPAIVLVIVAFLGLYVGLVASASVLGAALPMKGLRDKPILQLGAGLLVLYVASLVPGIGGILTIIAVVVGYGALMLTRFKPVAFGE